MGRIEKEVLKFIDLFISENKKSERNFKINLQKLIEKLSLLLNQLQDSDISEDTILINTDGSSKGNPGPARIGIIMKNTHNNVILKEQKDIGISTNNQAEYAAVIEALKICIDKGYKKIILRSDSEVIINQINNKFKVNNTLLKELYTKVKELEDKFDSIKFVHVKREDNKEADLLSQ